MFLLSLVACADLEDGRAGLTEHTAGWAADQGARGALEWSDDAVLLWVGCLDCAADGTALSWDLGFVSAALGGRVYQLRVEDAVTCVNDVCFEWPSTYGGAVMEGWKVNSDELATTAGFQDEARVNVLRVCPAQFAESLMPYGQEAVAATGVEPAHPMAYTSIDDVELGVVEYTWLDAVSGEILYVPG